MAMVARADNKIIIGLEERNIEKLRAGQPFHKFAAETGLPFDLVIFYGKTGEDLVAAIKYLMSPETVVIDTRNARKN